MSFDLLSEPIRKFVRDKRWEQLKPIQAAAIQKIMSTEDNYILASRTASGKTEAAFLPVLSLANFKTPGIKVLYISPLIALINDQFLRVEELCKYLDVPVTKWHGEASKSLKDKILKEPEGVMLITPESIEAMFVNKPYNIIQLFSQLQFVIIDEIHSFFGSDRGVQLKSLLSRLQAINRNTFRVIGLSATIGDYEEAKRFAGQARKTTVLRDNTPKEVRASFRYFEGTAEELPLPLLKDLYLETKDNKVLIFPNSRGRTEEIAVKLKKIAQKVNGHPNYFSHHSSIDRDVREYVEYFAKNNRLQNFCIACTSTLELGIDIGTVDEVVQVDATHSIASLVQRLGRSGRRDGAISNLFLYATNRWSLIQSLACWLLYKEGFIEPPNHNDKPYDLVAHQTLSIVKGTSGMLLSDLIPRLKSNYAFSSIEESEITQIVGHLISTDMLERLGNEVIVGIEGEKVVNHRDFYSAFQTEENFKVINAGNKIGEVPYSLQIVIGENIFLAAKIWKIKDIDEKAKRIEVVAAKDGKKPSYAGGSGSVHSRVREKMLEILYCNQEYDFIDQASTDELDAAKGEFATLKIENFQDERPLFHTENKCHFFTFTGSRIENTLQLLFDMKNVKFQFDGYSGSFIIKLSHTELTLLWEQLPGAILSIDDFLYETLQSKIGMINISKWAFLLPLQFQLKLLKDRKYDIQATDNYLKKTKFISGFSTYE